MKRILKYQGLTLLWALFIFVLCSIKMGGISHAPMFFAGFDKLTHCGLFFVLAVLMCAGLLKNSTQYNLSIAQAFGLLIICLTFGGGIELLQMFVFTWRSGEWADLFADSLGTFMGLFSVLVTGWAIHYEKK
jgi:VanZ family protein